MSTPVMRGLARLVLGDPEGELGRAAAVALARVVLEKRPEPAVHTGPGSAHRVHEGIMPLQRQNHLEGDGPGVGGSDRGVVAAVGEGPGRVTAGHSSVDDNDEGTTRA